MPEGRKDTIDYKGGNTKNHKINKKNTQTNIKTHTLAKTISKTKGFTEEEVTMKKLGSHLVDLKDPPTYQHFLQDRSPCSTPKLLKDRSL